MKEVLHYPNLRTLLEIEKVIKNTDRPLLRVEIKDKLTKKIMHQTLNTALEYLESHNLIIDSHKGVAWNKKEVANER